MSRRASAYFALVLALGVTSTALAQSEADLERARAQFQQGVELSDQGRWPEAAARFRAVMEVRATGAVKYNLGVALEQTGEIAEASELLADVVDDPEVDRRMRRDAERLLASIEPRLGHLTVHVDGDEAGARITVDEDELALDRIGRPVPVDPGSHQVALRRGTEAVDARTVSVGEGESVEVRLDATAVPSPAEAAGTAVDDELLAAEDDGEHGGSVFGEWWFWTGVGALVVGAVLVGVLVSSGGEPDPVQGNLSPGVLEVRP